MAHLDQTTEEITETIFSPGAAELIAQERQRASSAPKRRL